MVRGLVIAILLGLPMTVFADKGFSLEIGLRLEAIDGAKARTLAKAQRAFVARASEPRSLIRSKKSSGILTPTPVPSAQPIGDTLRRPVIKPQGVDSKVKDPISTPADLRPEESHRPRRGASGQMRRAQQRRGQEPAALPRDRQQVRPRQPSDPAVVGSKARPAKAKPRERERGPGSTDQRRSRPADGDRGPGTGRARPANPRSKPGIRRPAPRRPRSRRPAPRGRVAPARRPPPRRPGAPRPTPRPTKPKKPSR